MQLVYLRFLFATVCLLLAGVATFNYVVDPAGVYRAGKVNPKAYVDALENSKYGLWVPENSFDERLVAKALTSHLERDECAIIGSSHVMQISSERYPRSLKDVCKSVLNLGVSGAAIEDHFALSFLALLNGHPKKIVLGVDPWTFSFGKDQRWSIYSDDYFAAREKIFMKKTTINSEILDKPHISRISNLINFEYTRRSVTAMLQEYRTGLPTIKAAPQIDPNVGGVYPVQLKDGSLVYSAKFIADANQNIIPIGGHTYKTDGKLNQQDAIDAYRALILWILSKDVEPILLMTPYHENVWKAPLSENAIALRATELIVVNLAQELSVKLIGSYDPKIVDCLSNEFFDHMHPTANCLMKLRVRLSVPSASGK